MESEIRHLQQMKGPNAYHTPPGNYRNFKTTDGLVIRRRCYRVRHFAYACKANLPPSKAPIRYQNHRHNYIPHDTSQYLHPSYIPNQHSHRAPYKTNDKRHDTMGYPCTQHAIYTNPSQKPLFLSADQTDRSIKLEGLVSQVSTRIIVTWSKIVLCRTNSASY